MNAAEIAVARGGRAEGGAGRCECPVCHGSNLTLSDGRKRLLVKCWSNECEPKAILAEFRRLGFINGRDTDPPHIETPEETEAREKAAAAKRQKDIANAIDIWRHTLPAENICAVYLASRLLIDPIPPTLRFAPNFRHKEAGGAFPAMIGLVEHVTDGDVGVHAIYLNPLDPSVRVTLDPPKRSIGPITGGAVRLAPAGPTLAIAEGIEDALTFMQASGLPCWAAITATGIRNFVPPPLTETQTIILIEDQDKNQTGQNAVAATAKRLSKAGYTIKIARPTKGHKDINEALMKLGLHEPLYQLDDYQPEPRTGISLDDFYAYLPSHQFIYVPTRELWLTDSVNDRFTMVDTGRINNEGKPIKFKPSVWLARNRPVEQMTWFPTPPGEPPIIRDKFVNEGGWIRHPGATVFNLYLPPPPMHGNPNDVAPWIDHIRNLYPDDIYHIICFLAHRVQRPWEKINHALVLGGAPRIGKDTIVEPAKRRVGSWNFQEESPARIMKSQFNGYLKGVILRINETRDLGDSDRYSFYEHMKPYIASPPDVIRVNEKNIREHAVFNVVSVIETTNHKADGMYLPANDGRHYVAWSERTREEFTDDYYKKLWDWLDNGGTANVAAYLAQPERLTGFNPKALPPKTPAFWDIVNAHAAPEEAELLDAIEKLGNPDIVTLRKIISACLTTFTDDNGKKYNITTELAAWLKERRNSRQIPHRLEACGYVAVRNPTAKSDGLWKLEGERRTVYGKAKLGRGALVGMVENAIRENRSI